MTHKPVRLIHVHQRYTTKHIPLRILSLLKQPSLSGWTSLESSPENSSSSPIPPSTFSIGDTAPSIRSSSSHPLPCSSSRALIQQQYQQWWTHCQSKIPHRSSSPIHLGPWVRRIPFATAVHTIPHSSVHRDHFQRKRDPVTLAVNHHAPKLCGVGLFDRNKAGAYHSVACSIGHHLNLLRKQLLIQRMWQ